MLIVQPGRFEAAFGACAAGSTGWLVDRPQDFYWLLDVTTIHCVRNMQPTYCFTQHRSGTWDRPTFAAGMDGHFAATVVKPRNEADVISLTVLRRGSTTIMHMRVPIGRSVGWIGRIMYCLLSVPVQKTFIICTRSEIAGDKQHNDGVLDWRVYG